jgi:hypothetical protein
MARHAYAEACPKLAESQRLDPGGGTLLTLALCHEAEGKTATAWKELNEALAVATKDGHTNRASIARSRAAALEPKLLRLKVHVSAAAAHTPGIEVRCDEVVLAPAAWGVAQPVDAGQHHVVATAPGKKSAPIDVEVGPGAAVAEVTIAELDDLPPPPGPEAPKPAERVDEPAPRRPPVAARRTLETREIAGITAGGAGLIVVGVATYLALHALSEQRQADKICPMSACSDPGAVNLNHDARTSADFATGGFVLGGVAIAGGALLALWPRAHDSVPRAGVAPMVARSGGGVVMGGAW